MAFIHERRADGRWCFSFYLMFFWTGVYYSALSSWQRWQSLFQTHLTFHNCGGSSCSYFEGIQLTKKGLVSISLWWDFIGTCGKHKLEGLAKFQNLHNTLFPITWFEKKMFHQFVGILVGIHLYVCMKESCSYKKHNYIYIGQDLGNNICQDYHGKM